MTKTRFAPSPTGLVHIGNVRTALFCYLYAKHQQGTFLLRIEDTDIERSKQEYTEQLAEDLAWLGLDWQEGYAVNGEYGPYYQSERADIYQTYYQQLIDDGKAYPCFCSEESLALSRKAQLAAGQPPRYPGTCRSLSGDEVNRKLDEGKKPTLRFKMPRDEQIEYIDTVKGKQSFRTNDIGDFIIRRSNQMPSFMFSNAIDDALMKVTQVLRGDDHLTNSPRQIMILKALDLPIPEYGHISLIVGPSGSPLSKREGSKSVKQLKEEGYFPLAILNYLARLGHYYESDNLMEKQTLIDDFSLERLSSAPARYDQNQLLYWQKEVIAASDSETLWAWLAPTVASVIPETKQTLFTQTITPNITFPSEAMAWAHICCERDVALDEDAKAILSQAPKVLFELALEFVVQPDFNYKTMLEKLKNEAGVKGKGLFQPLRIALTGQCHGPELEPLFNLIESDIRQYRFEQARALAGS